MTTNGSGHESYLLRLWRAHGAQPWRAWVQCAVSGEVVRFTSPEALCAYLADGPPDPATGPADAGDATPDPSPGSIVGAAGNNTVDGGTGRDDRRNPTTGPGCP